MLFTVVEIVIQQVLLLLLLLFLSPKHPKNPNIPLSSFAVVVVEGDVLLIASSSSSDLTRTHNRFSRFRNHVTKESHWLRDFFICRISLFKDSINVESWSIRSLALQHKLWSSLTFAFRAVVVVELVFICPSLTATEHSFKHCLMSVKSARNSSFFAPRQCIILFPP